MYHANLLHTWIPRESVQWANSFILSWESTAMKIIKSLLLQDDMNDDKRAEDTVFGRLVHDFQFPKQRAKLNLN